MRERLLHHRRGVDEYLDVAAGVFDEPAPETFETRLDQLVVVVALGVDRYGAARARFQDRQRIIGRTVVDAEHHHRAHLGPQRARIAAPLGVLRHPFHVAMFAGGEEGAQPLARARDRIGPRDPDNFETMGARGGGERALERGRSQKSRLA